MKPTLPKLLFLLLCTLALGSCQKHPPSLSLLVWEGYADPSFIHAFEESHHCKITASYMGSSDDLVAKLRGGSASNYDVISPSSDVATSIARAGLAEPLDLTKIPTYSQLSPRLHDLPLVKVNGQTLGVPFMWGPNPLLYNTGAFPKAPDSWAIFWDPKYKGKISVWDDLSTLYMAAQLLGYDKPDPSQLYNLSDDQLAAVKQKLLALKPNVRKLWSTGGELTNLFENHEIIAAMGWPLMTNQLRQANFPIGEIIPKENTTGWIDHLMITKASPNKDLAYAFLEYMVQAQTQKKITDITHYTPANPAAAQFMTEAEKKGLHLDDPDAYMQRIYFWQDVPRRAKYIETWNEVKAAPVNSAPSSPPSSLALGATLLEVRNIAKNFGPREVLKHISLQIAPGEFLTLLGESGSGKTTLLRLIAGFEQPTSGEIWMSGARLDTLPPYKRRVNTVFQHYALFPHLSVSDNVAYGLRVTNAPAAEIPARVDAALRMVKMQEYAATRPSRLSGGQQQRVALARALVNRPQLLLLDEPLSALDANLRKQMQSELKSLQRELGITFLFVTHDQEEAMALSDRIALLKDGALEQVAFPREIYARPATSYAAQFIGQTNLLRANVNNGIAICGSLRWTTAAPNGSALFSLRPESIQLAAEAGAVPNQVHFRASIHQQIFSGSVEQLEVDCAGQLLRVRIPARGVLTGEHEFVFNPADAIPVSDGNL